MKSKLLAIILFLFCPILFGQARNSIREIQKFDTLNKQLFLLQREFQKFDTLNKQIFLMQREITDLKEELSRLDSENRTISELCSRSNEAISNQIAESSNFLQVWGYIAAVIGVIFAVYITWIQNKVSKIFKESKIIFRDQIRTKQEMKKTQDLINNNLGKLYSQLQEQEINYLIERMKNVPEDFENIFNRLAVINIPNKYFNEFKILILANNALIDTTKQDNYIITLMALSIQHFPKETVNDNELREIMLKKFNEILTCLFVKEIERLIESICLFIANQPLTSNLSLVSILLSGLQERGKNEIPILTKSLWNNLMTSERRNEFKKQFENDESFRRIIKEFITIK